jgi:hypothetical protein
MVTVAIPVNRVPTNRGVARHIIGVYFQPFLNPLGTTRCCFAGTPRILLLRGLGSLLTWRSSGLRVGGSGRLIGMPKLAPDVASRLSAGYPEVVDYLTVNSGLPGPRGNLELLAASGELLPLEHGERLRAEANEYLRCCGVLVLPRQLGDDPAGVTLLLTRAAADHSWRVREAVAMAAQRIGDDDFDALLALVDQWLEGPDPLVQRAAVAAICEPRLLHSEKAAAQAIRACSRATLYLLTLGSEQRRQADARTLRQALGYCWSVAVAADPAAGLPAFLDLDETDVDLGWIVRTNRTKARLRRLLPT